MKFKEYIKIESDDSINQVMSGDWISKSRSAWKAVDDEDNTIEIHNDGHDPELNGESWTVHENTFVLKRLHITANSFWRLSNQ